MTDPHTDAVEVAILFHDTYERLAPSFGYKTRDDTKQFDPESKNWRLMVATCGVVAAAIRAQPSRDDVIEACAVAMENLAFFTPIEELLHMTKQEMSVRTCREGAAAIRALKESQ